MPKTLIVAARAVIYQRDYCALHGQYDTSTFRPDDDQCFDDWAADILSTSMKTDGVPVLHPDAVND